MTDRELLELAAKAAGLRIEGDADRLVVFQGHYAGGFSVLNEHGGSSLWNPLTDPADALRLAVAVGHRRPVHIGIIAQLNKAYCHVEDSSTRECISTHADAVLATCRAIVRAAAEIGKAMP